MLNTPIKQFLRDDYLTAVTSNMKKIFLLFICSAIVFLLTGNMFAHKAHKHLPPSSENPAGKSIIQNQNVKVNMHTYEYYFNLFLTLAADLPTELQQETINHAGAVFPHIGKSPGPDGLAENALAFYNKLREKYPVVNVVLRNSGAVLAPNQSPVKLTRGLDRFVLVEVKNETTNSFNLTAAFGTNPGQSAFLPVGNIRAFALKLKSDKTADKDDAILNLVFKENSFNIPVPVTISKPAIIRGKLKDTASGKIWPGRVYVKGSDGVYRHAKAYADIKTVSEKQLLQFPGKNYKLPFFYSDGTFEITVPSGEVEIKLERGFEHEIVHKHLEANPGKTHDIVLESGRFLDMKKRNWISGDTHVHWVKNHWSENEDMDLLRVVQHAEDLRVVNNLTLLHRALPRAFITPSQFPMGPVPGFCDNDYHVQMAEEYRNQEFYGHLCFLNIKRIILPISTGKGMAGSDAIDYPINKTAILDCRSQGGISTEAHGLGLNWDVPVNVIHKLTDSLDQSSPPDYYRFLDCGFKLPLSDGSDHPARLAGCARVYVKTDGDFTYEKWIDGIRKCRTFTTSGPLLFLNVNGADIGDEITPKKGETIKIIAKALSRHPIGNFQIISNGGEILCETNVPGREAELSIEIPADKSRWVVARCSPNDNYGAIFGPNVAHTSAIYVTTDGKPVFREEAAQHWAEQMRKHSKDISERAHFANDDQRKEAVGYIDDGVKLFEKLIEKHK